MCCVKHVIIPSPKPNDSNVPLILQNHPELTICYEQVLAKLKK
jgi:hypothetical protein